MFPFLPLEAEAARRHFLEITGGLFFEEFGFVYAFCPSGRWGDTYLAINQGPVVAMIENCRPGLPQHFFMNAGGPAWLGSSGL
ncbi:glucoamylase family protein [Sinorhizobium meliloti]|uniref:glucoamylase family protein n=1 Tax=Rhizobium meliloti TaxID=382 RepID=UPI0013E3447D